MRESSKDKAKGKFHEVKGKIRQTVGRAAHKPGLEARGQVEKISGRIQGKLGQAERALEK